MAEDFQTVLNEVAAKVAGSIPKEMIERVFASKISSAFDDLAGRWHEKDKLSKIMDAAVKARVEELLADEYKSRVDEIARVLANEALALARNEVCVKRKERSRY